MSIERIKTDTTVVKGMIGSSSVQFKFDNNSGKIDVSGEYDDEHERYSFDVENVSVEDVRSLVEGLCEAMKIAYPNT